MGFVSGKYTLIYFVFFSSYFMPLFLSQIVNKKVIIETCLLFKTISLIRQGRGGGKPGVTEQYGLQTNALLWPHLSRIQQDFTRILLRSY